MLIPKYHDWICHGFLRSDIADLLCFSSWSMALILYLKYTKTPIVSITKNTMIIMVTKSTFEASENPFLFCIPKVESLAGFWQIHGGDKAGTNRFSGKKISH
jgi:hypothetical protein